MAKIGVDSPADSGKRGFSSRLLQMKFMQRKEKRKAEEVVEQVSEPEAEDAQWVASTSQRGCILICEPDPPPGASLGRLKFSGNAESQKEQNEIEERLDRAKAGKGDTPVVSDLEMARNMGHNDDRVSSMRMQKKKARKK